MTNMQLQIFRGKKKIKTWQSWRRSWTQPGINWQRCDDVDGDGDGDGYADDHYDDCYDDHRGDLW